MPRYRSKMSPGFLFSVRAFFASLSLLGFLGCGLCELIEVEISLGNVTGSIENVTVHDGNGGSTTESYAQYLGIPYAEPPTGFRRFAKPEAQGVWSTSHNGTYSRPSCYYLNRDIPGSFQLKNLELSEDCLTLNIYTPSTNTSGLDLYPVIIFIHNSPGTSKPFVGDVLSSVGKVVVVVINFRQDLLGFLSTGDEAAPGNLGLWDQQMAIQWVREHIDKFGGDANLMTLVGHSTGASDAILQSLYGPNKGAIKGVVAMSGTPIPTYDNTPANVANGMELAKSLNCNTDSSSAAIECLREKTIEELETAVKSLSTSMTFKPIVDGEFLKADPRDILNNVDGKYTAERSGFTDIGLILGLNNMEGGAHVALMWKDLLKTDANTFQVNRTEFETIVVPTAMRVVFGNNTPQSITETVAFQYSDLTNPTDSATIRDNVVNLSTDIDLAAALVKTANAHSKDNDNKTFLYQFSEELGIRSPLTPEWLKGANRGNDVYFLFGFSQRGLDVLEYGANFTPTAKQRVVSNYMIGAIAEFAGNRLSSTLWTPYDQTTMAFLDISYNMTSSKRHFREPFMTFWTKLIPSLIKDFLADKADDDSFSMADPCPNDGGYLFNIDMVTAENIILALSIVGVCLLLAVILICSLSVVTKGGSANKYHVNPVQSNL